MSRPLERNESEALRAAGGISPPLVFLNGAEGSGRNLVGGMGSVPLWGVLRNYGSGPWFSLDISLEDRE